MTTEHFNPVPLDTKAELGRAMQRAGFKAAWDGLEEEYAALNPVFEIEGARFVMATQGMAAVPLAILKHPVSSLEHRRTEVVAAVDLLFQGF